MPMEAKLSDPDCTCSAFTEQWSMCGLKSTILDFGPHLWTDIHNCGLWFIWTKQYKYSPVT